MGGGGVNERREESPSIGEETCPIGWSKEEKVPRSPNRIVESRLEAACVKVERKSSVFESSYPCREWSASPMPDGLKCVLDPLSLMARTGVVLVLCSDGEVMSKEYY